MAGFSGTKGKWVLKTFPDGQMSVRNENDSRKICVPRVQNYEESLANLLLISKAPEMLEMLKKIYTARVEGGDFDTREVYRLIKESTQL